MRSGCTTMPADDAREAAEHVIERDEAVGQDDALDRRVRDVALVPERDVLERRHGSCRGSAAPARRSARSRSGCACAASPTSPSGLWRTAPRLRRFRFSAGRGFRARTSRATRAVIASADSSSAWRSRWMTCDATGAGSRPSARQTSASIDGGEMREGADGAGELADARRRRARAARARRRAAAPRTTARASGRTSSARRARRACGRSSACAGARSARSRTASVSAVEVA